MTELGSGAPGLSDGARSALRRMLLSTASLESPVDLTGSVTSEHLFRALATALDEYDMALVATLAHPLDLDEGIADIILDAVKRDKPIAVVSIGSSR